MYRDTVPKNYILFIMVQVMSESVASALEFVDNDATQQTRLFIRMIDRFFDLLNVKVKSSIRNT